LSRSIAAGQPVSSRFAGGDSSRPGALDLGCEHVGQFDFGRGGAASGNMNAKLGEPVELESGASRAGVVAMTRRPAPGERSPEMNEGASSAQFAPARPAAMTSTMSAILAPRAPPKARSAPRSAACGSVVGCPSPSTAQPAGSISPRSA
jgi:hypothetical protein